MKRSSIVLSVAILGACNGTPETNPARSTEPLVIVHTREDAPTWTVRYGEELWHRGAATAAGEIDIGGVIDRVSHAIVRSDPDALPRADAESFVATFDDRGLRFSPHDAVALPAVADPRAEISIGTARVAIGDHEVYRADGRAIPRSILGNTAQGLLDATTGLVEHFEVRGEGVEVSWVLRERPAAGELVVDVAIGGLAFAGSSSEGSHYATSDGIARVRIGNAELVDARGTRWPLVTELVEGRPRWRVDADLLATAEFPIAIDPTVSAEIGIDQPMITPGVVGHQDFAAVASNHTGYLVVWQDERNGIDIYGARVLDTGVIEDLEGFTISTAAGNQLTPAVASNGTDYLVVWDDKRSGTSDIYAARVTADGMVPVADASGIAISTAAGVQSVPSVASDGTDYLVSWEDQRTGDIEVYAARVTSAGAVPTADANGIVLSTVVGFDLTPSVASNGTDYFVVWAQNNDVVGARVTSAGTVPAADTNGFVVRSGTDVQRYPAVASDGSDYLVVWADGVGGNLGGDDIYGARVTAGGTVVDPTGFAINTFLNLQTTPAIAFNGTDYLVVWNAHDNNDSIRGARITIGTGVTVGGVITLSDASGDEQWPAVASNGTDFLVAWHQNLGQGFDIVGARVTAAGTVPAADANGIVITNGPNLESSPAVAANGNGFLVAWMDNRNGAGADIYGARLSPTGAVEDMTAFAISTAAGTQQSPKIASDGTDYLVVWDDFRTSRSDVYGARVTAAGVVPAADANGIRITTGSNSESRSAVASNGTDYFVVWRDLRSGQLDIYGARVTSAGTVPAADAAGIAISTAPYNQYTPAIASNHTDYLVVWTDEQLMIDWDIFGARVTGAGVVLDPSGIPISTATGEQSSASVASNGSDYLVAWTDDRSNVSYDIYGARVTAAGAVPDAAGIPISTATGHQLVPAVASNGPGYLVAWQDGGVYGAHVTAAGTIPVDDAAGLAISTGNGEGAPAAVGDNARGTYLVAYTTRNRTAVRFVTACGDAAISAGEICDDGNTDPADGCSATCTAEPGFTCTGTPSACTDNDECATDNGGCSVDPLVACINTPGSSTCGACPAGFSGDGHTCVDIDECATDNGGCSVDPLVTCTNTLGSSTCGACPAGFSGDGHTCADIDECASDNGGCSVDPLVACINTPGSSTCGACPAGFSGDGHTCVDIDECATATDDCAADATCTNIAGSFTCACNDGFTGDGATCEPVPSDGGCQVGSSRPPTGLVIVFGILALRRRRRRRSPRV